MGNVGALTPTRVILLLFGAIVALIISTSFVLSYSNLAETAIEAGISPLLAPMWPVCLDAFLLAGSLFILRANLVQESASPGWAVLLVFTGVSTLFNVYHSPQNIFAQAAHAVPPIALCISLELLMMILKSDLMREAPKKENEPENIPEKVEETPKKEPKKLREPKKVTENRDDEVRNWFIDNPDGSVNKCRTELGMTWNYVNKVRKEMS